MTPSRLITGVPWAAARVAVTRARSTGCGAGPGGRPPRRRESPTRPDHRRDAAACGGRRRSSSSRRSFRRACARVEHRVQCWRLCRSSRQAAVWLWTAAPRPSAAPRTTAVCRVPRCRMSWGRSVKSDPNDGVAKFEGRGAAGGCPTVGTGSLGTGPICANAGLAARQAMRASVADRTTGASLVDVNRGATVRPRRLAASVPTLR